MIDGGKIHLLFTPPAVLPHGQRNECILFSRSCQMLIFFFSPSFFLLLHFFLYQQTVTLNAEGVLSENKVQSVWR